MKPANEPVHKIGEGHAAAMLRQGFKEIQAALYPGSNIAREPEVGTFGHPTQGEIASDRKADLSRSAVDAHVQDARTSKVAREQSAREIAPPEPDLERD
jgi:hypothetical protein